MILLYEYFSSTLLLTFFWINFSFFWFCCRIQLIGRVLMRSGIKKFPEKLSFSNAPDSTPSTSQDDKNLHREAADLILVDEARNDLKALLYDDAVSAHYDKLQVFSN